MIWISTTRSKKIKILHILVATILPTLTSSCGAFWNVNELLIEEAQMKSKTIEYGSSVPIDDSYTPPKVVTKVEEYKLSHDVVAAFEPRTPTPSRFFSADLSMPDNFAPTNNLVKKPGAFYRSYGEVIFVQGEVTDSFGVPIEGAVIEIWQTNAAGKYHTLLEPDSEYVDKYFSMSGRAITDNLGNYYFITIMPGANPGRAPHINMNIYHPKFGKLETEMYFENHPYNRGDYQFMTYSEKERKLVTASVRHSNITDPSSNKLCTFNIVMKGIHQFKGF